MSAIEEKLLDIAINLGVTGIDAIGVYWLFKQAYELLRKTPKSGEYDLIPKHQRQTVIMDDVNRNRKFGYVFSWLSPFMFLASILIAAAVVITTATYEHKHELTGKIAEAQNHVSAQEANTAEKVDVPKIGDRTRIVTDD